MIKYSINSTRHTHLWLIAMHAAQFTTSWSKQNMSSAFPSCFSHVVIATVFTAVAPPLGLITWSFISGNFWCCCTHVAHRFSEHSSQKCVASTCLASRWHAPQSSSGSLSSSGMAVLSKIPPPSFFDLTPFPTEETEDFRRRRFTFDVWDVCVDGRLFDATDVLSLRSLLTLLMETLSAIFEIIDQAFTDLLSIYLNFGLTLFYIVLVLRLLYVLCAHIGFRRERQASQPEIAF